MESLKVRNLLLFSLCSDWTNEIPTAAISTTGHKFPVSSSDSHKIKSGSPQSIMDARIVEPDEHLNYIFHNMSSIASRVNVFIIGSTIKKSLIN